MSIEAATMVVTDRRADHEARAAHYARYGYAPPIPLSQWTGGVHQRWLIPIPHSDLLVDCEVAS